MKELEETNLSYLPEPLQTYGNLLQTEMLRLQAERPELTGDKLWKAAVDVLGNNEDERYCRFYTCHICGQMYHDDYADSDFIEGYDFCGYECQAEAGYPDCEICGEMYHEGECDALFDEEE